MKVNSDGKIVGYRVTDNGIEEEYFYSPDELQAAMDSEPIYDSEMAAMRMMIRALCYRVKELENKEAL